MQATRFPRLRFSLRTAFVVTTLLCIWLAWHIHATKRQKRAVEAIRASGGWVAYDYAWKDGEWVKGGKTWAPKWLTNAVGEDACHRVVAVNLSALFHSGYEARGAYVGHDPDALVPDELWQAVENLPSTEWLSLNARNISDAELRHLSGLKRLKELKMEAVPIDGSGLKHLLHLPNLEHLNLSRIHLKDEHAPLMMRMQQLRQLGLNESTISPAVAAEIEQKMPACIQYYEPWPPAPDPSNPWVGIRFDLAPEANDRSKE